MNHRAKYLHRAKVVACVLRFVPFLRMAGLNGSLVRGDEKASSDIDILIIAKYGRLYTARFFATILVHLTGYRRYADKIAGRICLNCYLSDDDPDISPKNPKSRQKVANAYKYLIPLVGCSCQEKKFFAANKWMNKYRVKLQKGLTLASLRGSVPRTEWPMRPIPIFDWFFESTFGDLFEKIMMRWQIRRISHGRDGFDELVATEKEIRLHPRKK